MAQPWEFIGIPVDSADGGGIGSVRSLRQLLSCIRLEEVFVLQGAPLLGALLSMERVSVQGVSALTIFAVGSCLLVAHVFVLNDWSGMQADLRDPHRASSVFTNRGVGRNAVRSLAIALLVLSLPLLLRSGPDTFVLALLIAGLSALYSAPRLAMKGIPLGSSALHLLGGCLHFLLGYTVFGAIDTRGVAIGCAVGLIFAAGHLTHEVRDADSDLRSGIRTNAVAFGKSRTFVVGLVLFAMAHALLTWLASARMLTLPVQGPAALFALHLYWAIQAKRANLTFRHVRSLQIRYRILYALAAVVLAVSLLFAAR